MNITAHRLALVAATFAVVVTVGGASFAAGSAPAQPSKPLDLVGSAAAGASPSSGADTMPPDVVYVRPAPSPQVIHVTEAAPAAPPNVVHVVVAGVGGESGDDGQDGGD